MENLVKTIWTIGHSTRNIEEFLAILKFFQIEVLADVRHYPGSRKFPQYNQESLQESLCKQGIAYVSLVELGGRRKPHRDSTNTIWRNEAFRGYADYMETEPFKQGITTLAETGCQRRTAYMCSEAVWWRCHRALISDYLKADGWTVLHIMKTDKAVEHPFTSAYISTQQEKNSGDG